MKNLFKNESTEEKNAYSVRCLESLEKWINENETRISPRKFINCHLILSGEYEPDSAGRECINPGKCYDKKWFAEELRARGIQKLDLND